MRAAPASLLAYGRSHHCDCGAALSIADPVGGPCLACAADPKRGLALSRGAYLCAAGVMTGGDRVQVEMFGMSETVLRGEAQMTLLTVTLPWPAKELSPNFHGHWRKRWAAAQAAKFDAQVATLEALSGTRYVIAKRLRVRATFYPPDQRKRDRDNAYASTKHYFDGIALALGVDDNTFEPSYAWGGLGEWVSGGKVIVEVSQ